jgi:hypothetical protein
MRMPLGSAKGITMQRVVDLVHGISRSCVALLLIASALALQAPTQVPAAQAEAYTGWGFTLELGQDLTVRERRPGPDFELYDIRARADTGGVLFSIYAGDHPQAGDLSGAEEVSAPLPGLTLRRRAPDGRLSRDVILELPTAANQPTRVHAWYRGLDSAGAGRADQAIATIKPAGPEVNGSRRRAA